MLRGMALLVATVLAVAGCAVFDPRPEGKVILYGRNGAPDLAWFGLTPVGDPPEHVGFGPDDGAACLVGAAGTEVVSFDGAPNEGGRPRRSIGRVPGEAHTLVLWVEVARDGTLVSGAGVPPWWVGDPQVC